MIRIILIIIAICVIISILQKVWEVFGGLIKIALGIIISILAIKLIISNLSLIFTVIKFALSGFVILMALGYIITLVEKKQIKKWLNQDVSIMSRWQVEDMICPYSNVFYDSDGNSGAKFVRESLPYGRVNAFLNYFGLNSDMEEPIYYSAQRSKTDIELREYGTLVTLSGIYFSKQLSTLNSDNEYEVLEKNIPFNGLWKTQMENNNLVVKYIKDKKESSVKITCEDTTIALDKVKELCDKIIDSKISLAMLSNKVISQDEYEEAINKGNNHYDKSAMTEGAKNLGSIAGVVGAKAFVDGQLNINKNFMNGSRGHGYGAEYANNTLDKLAGKKVVNAAQNLENGRQVKHGADRIVDGVNIQTKYYKTASESIGAAFENKQAIYKNSDGSMMQIEVPRDQYAKACDAMQKRIDKGEVPGAKPGDDPRKYVRKGYLTYAQSYNICKSGSVESIAIDTINGAITSSVAGGITAVAVFAYAVWNGEDIEEAAKAGLTVGLQVVGRGAMIYTLTMQLSRSEFINPFVRQATKDGVSQGFAGVTNPVFTLSENVANNINKSAIAKTTMGKKLGLDSIKGNQVISGGVTAVIIFGPDICRALSGRISTKQLFKNASVGAAGIGGGILGQMLIPIPYIGAMIGGGIGSFIAKQVLDQFIEDDAKEMFQILKEEFLDVVMLSNLGKEEFDEVVNETLCNKKLPSILRDMYASGEARKFAREAFVSIAVINVIAKREVITDAMLEEGYAKIALDAIEVHDLVAATEV